MVLAYSEEDDCINASSNEPVRLEDYSEGFKTFSLAYVCMVVFIVVTSLLWWYSRRKEPYLLRRRFILVIISSIGVLMELIAGTVDNFAKQVPCLIESLAFLTCFVVATWPLTVRTIMFYMQIHYNQVLAEGIVKGGEGSGISTSRDYLRKKFFASRKFSFLLTILVLIFFFIYASITASIICNEAAKERCGTSRLSIAGPPSYLIYLIFLALFLFCLNFYVIYRSKNEPDPLSIRREAIIAWSFSVSFGAPGALLFLYDVGGFESTEGSSWSWAFFIDLAFLTFFIISVPTQVFLSYYRGHAYEVKDFSEFLSSAAGIRYFALHLANEASLDNLLFYRAVEKWKNDFEEMDSEYAQEEALKIMTSYIYPYSEHEVFLNHKTLSQLKNSFNATQRVSRDVFDQAQAEIMRTMYTDSFHRFQNSDLYKLYLHSFDPEDEEVAKYERESLARSK